jgi:hypothetical protein
MLGVAPGPRGGPPARRQEHPGQPESVGTARTASWRGQRATTVAFVDGAPAAQVIWINGAFGAGKSSLTSAVRAAWPKAQMFDPEEVGFMLRDVVPPAPSGDFQDLPIWRTLVTDVTVRLLEHYRRPLVMPMTVVVPEYLNDIFTGLAERGVDVRHFFLKTRHQTLRAQIIEQRIWPDDDVRDAEVRAWRLAQVDRCVAAVDALPEGTVLLDGELPTRQLAVHVLENIGVTPEG